MIPAPVPSSLPFGHAKPSLRRPRLDDQQRRLRVQPGEDDLGNVGQEQIPVGLFASQPIVGLGLGAGAAAVAALAATLLRGEDD